MAEIFDKFSAGDSQLAKYFLELLGSAVLNAHRQEHKSPVSPAPSEVVAKVSKSVPVSPKDDVATSQRSLSDDENARTSEASNNNDPALGRPRYQWKTPEKSSFEKDKRKGLGSKDLFSVYVGHLPCDITESEVVDLFKDVGEVMDVFVFPTRSEQGAYTYGFVRFLTLEEAKEAIREKHLQVLGNMQIHVEIAEDTKRKIGIINGGDEDDGGNLLRKDRPKVVRPSSNEAEDKLVMAKIKTSLCKFKAGNSRCSWILADYSVEEMFENLRMVLKMLINFPMALADASAYDEGDCVPEKPIKQASVGNPQTPCKDIHRSAMVGQVLTELTSLSPRSARIPSHAARGAHKVDGDGNDERYPKTMPSSSYFTPSQTTPPSSYYTPMTSSSSYSTSTDKSTFTPPKISRGEEHDALPEHVNPMLVNEVQAFLSASSSDCQSALSEDCTSSEDGRENHKSTSSIHKKRHTVGAVERSELVGKNIEPESKASNSGNAEVLQGMRLPMAALSDQTRDNKGSVSATCIPNDISQRNDTPSLNPSISHDFQEVPCDSRYSRDKHNGLSRMTIAGSAGSGNNQDASVTSLVSFPNVDIAKSPVTSGEMRVSSYDENSRSAPSFTRTSPHTDTRPLPSGNHEIVPPLRSTMNDFNTNHTSYDNSLSTSSLAPNTPYNDARSPPSINHDLVPPSKSLVTSGEKHVPSSSDDNPSTLACTLNIFHKDARLPPPGNHDVVPPLRSIMNDNNVINHTYSSNDAGSPLSGDHLVPALVFSTTDDNSNNHAAHPSLDTTQMNGEVPTENPSRTNVLGSGLRELLLGNPSAGDQHKYFGTRSNIPPPSTCLLDIIPNPKQVVLADKTSDLEISFLSSKRNIDQAILNPLNSVNIASNMDVQPVIITKASDSSPTPSSITNASGNGKTILTSPRKQSSAKVNSPKSLIGRLAPCFAKPFAPASQSANRCNVSSISGNECHNAKNYSENPKNSLPGHDATIPTSENTCDVQSAELMTNDTAILSVAIGAHDSSDYPGTRENGFHPNTHTSKGAGEFDKNNQRGCSEAVKLQEHLEERCKKLEDLQNRFATLNASRPGKTRTLFESDASCDLEAQIHDAEVILQKASEMRSSRRTEQELAYEREVLRSDENKELLSELVKEMENDRLTSEVSTTELKCKIIEMKMKLVQETQ